MKKLFALLMSVVSALTVLCISASAATLGKSVEDANNTISTGDSSATLIIIIAAVAVIALAVIIISIVASKKNKK